MTRNLQRLLVTLLCALLLSGGMLAVTAPPASAATIGGMDLLANDSSTVFGQDAVFFATLSAATAPTGTVDFVDGVTAVCTGETLVVQTATSSAAECTVSTLSVGTHSISATYGGDLDYDPASSTTFEPALSQVVSAADTTTVVAADTNPSTFGDSVTFTADVEPVVGTAIPTGVVTFKSDSVDIVGCEAETLVGGSITCATDALSGGSRTITAVYAPDPNFLASTSPGFSQTVEPAATSTALSASPDPSTFNESVDLDATVTSPAGTPTGTVAFKDGSTDIVGCEAVALAAGAAHCATTELGVGSQTLTAVYGGAPSFATSTSSGVAHEVDQASTSTSVVSDLSPSRFSAPVVFTASVTSTAGTPTGTVAFRAGGTNISGCAARLLASGGATCTTSALTLGGSTITVLYSSDPSFSASTSTGIDQTVNAASTTTAVASSDTTTSWNQAVTLTATTSATAPATLAPGGGTVSFTADGTPITSCSAQAVTAGAASCTTSSLPVGATSITAIYSGIPSHLTSESSAITQTVSLAATTTTVASNHNPSRWGQAVSLSATVASGAGVPTGSVKFFMVRKDDTLKLIGTHPLVVGVASMTTDELPVRIGEIVADYQGGPGFATSTTRFGQTVSRTFSGVTLTSSANPSVLGRAVTFRAAVWSSGDGAGTPEGLVALYRVRPNGSRAWIGRAFLNAGVATIQILDEPLGVHKIVAEYRGDVHHRESSRQIQQRVNRR